MDPDQRRGGRALKLALPGSRVKLSMDVGWEIKNRLDVTAKAAGRSQGAEAEDRLRWSFDFEDSFGGRRAVAFFRALASEVAALYPDETWLEEPGHFAAVRALLIRRLRATTIIPPGEGQAALVDTAIQCFISSRDPQYLKTARELIEDPKFPVDRRAEALALIAEIEAEPEAYPPRRALFRVEMPPAFRPIDPAGGGNDPSDRSSARDRRNP
jgi:hypothetical protein